MRQKSGSARYASSHLTERLQDRFGETLANAVCLPVSGLGFCMLDVVQSQVELTVVHFRFATVFGATIREDADSAHALFGKK